MAISVGDAVLNFIADTTKMDQALDNVGPRTKAAMQPATDAVNDLGDAANDAGQSITKMPGVPERVPESTRAATEQVRFLSEEVGVRLPRAMSKVVADLPGVGSALNAAFAITALLFAIREVDELTDKFAKWVYGVKDSSEAMKTWNDTIMKADGVMKAAAHALDDYGKTADELAREQITELVNAMNDHTRSAEEAKFEMGYLTKGTDAYVEAERKFVEETKLAKAVTDEHTLAVKKLLDTEREDVRKQSLETLKKQIELTKQLTNVQITLQEANGLEKEPADELRYRASLKALNSLLAAEKKYGKDNEDVVRKTYADIEQLTVEHGLKIKQEFDGAEQSILSTYDKIKTDVKNSDGVDIILPANVAKLMQFRTEVKELGVTLDADLVQKINLAKKALTDYAEQGGKDAYTVLQLKSALQQLQRQYANFPEREKVLEDELREAKAHHQNTEEIEKEIAALRQEEKQLGLMPHVFDENKTALDQLRSTGTSAFLQMESSFSGAISSMMHGQESFGKAMVKATYQMIASMAQKWAEYFLAMAIGNLFVDPAASAEEIAAGTALEAIAGVMGGLGGSSSSSSSNTYAYNNGQSNTTSQAGSGRTSIGIQHFAEGGLITAPTLAVIGEGNSREAAIPLDDPEAMRTIGKALADAGGRGGPVNHFHFHAPVVGASDVSKLCNQINKRVARGQANLNASSTFKVTRRGA